MTYFIPFILVSIIELLFNVKVDATPNIEAADSKVDVIWMLFLLIYIGAIFYFFWIRFVLKFDFDSHDLKIKIFNTIIKRIPKENIEINLIHENIISILEKNHLMNKSNIYKLYIPKSKREMLSVLTKNYNKGFCWDEKKFVRRKLYSLLPLVKVISIFGLVLLISFFTIFRDQKEAFSVYGTLKNRPSLIMIGYILGHKMNDEIRSKKHTEGGINLVFIAVTAKNYLALDFIFNMGGDVNFVDKYDGRSPIFYAAKNHDKKMIDYLISKGANLEIRDNSGLTVIEFSKKQGCDVCF